MRKPHISLDFRPDRRLSVDMIKRMSKKLVGTIAAASLVGIGLLGAGVIGAVAATDQHPAHVIVKQASDDSTQEATVTPTPTPTETAAPAPAVTVAPSAAPAPADSSTDTDSSSTTSDNGSDSTASTPTIQQTAVQQPPSGVANSLPGGTDSTSSPSN